MAKTIGERIIIMWTDNEKTLLYNRILKIEESIEDLKKDQERAKFQNHR